MLLEQILSRENLQNAIIKTREHKGSIGRDNLMAEQLDYLLEISWPKVKAAILEGTYKPGSVRRIEVLQAGYKPGIIAVPTLLDRFIQQAIGQQLCQINEKPIPRWSYGFRSGQNAYEAVLIAEKHLSEGYKHVVDLEMRTIFEPLSHYYLMDLLSQRIEDQRVLHLIEKYLVSGLMLGGLFGMCKCCCSEVGPLSPMLANFLLEILDRELERRGYRFVRYIDDCSIYVKSKSAASQIAEKVKEFVKREYFLQSPKNRSVAVIQS